MRIRDDPEELALIHRLKQLHPSLAVCTDQEVAECYELYCHLFHAANWVMEGDYNHFFVYWATTPPIVAISRYHEHDKRDNLAPVTDGDNMVST